MGRGEAETMKKKGAMLVGIHNGGHHTDDAAAEAELELAYPEVKFIIIRTRDESTLAGCDYCLDVANVYNHATGRYDHHQGAGARDNGVLYASVGLVHKHHGVLVCGGDEKAAAYIDGVLIQPIDATDNGFRFSKDDFWYTPYSLERFISRLRPTWTEVGNGRVSAAQDSAFIRAKDVMKLAILREVEFFKSHRAAVHDRYATEVGAEAVLRLAKLGPKDVQKFHLEAAARQKGGKHTAEIRNGAPFLAFGLAWEYFGVKICGGDEKAAKRIDWVLVQAIDSICDGKGFIKRPLKINPYTIEQFISRLRPNWTEGGKNPALVRRIMFNKAVEMMTRVIQRELAFFKDQELATTPVVESGVRDATDKRIIVLKKKCSWERVLMEKSTEALFVIFLDRADNRWRVYGVPDEAGGRRKLLPESWSGKEGKELEDITGVSGARFCHVNRGVVVATTKEAAIKLATLAADAP